MGDSVARAIEAARVVVIARKGCSFSAEAVRLVQSRQLNHAVFDMSELAPGAHAELTQLTGQRTVPYVFVDGKHVGGASDLIELDASGRLTTMLASEGSVATTAAIYAPYGSAKPEYLPALWRFPHSVDVHVVRVTGVLCCILSIVLGVFGILERDWATYATLVFASDFALRLVGGAKASLVGSIAQLICARWRPQFKPGPSKQFASLVGTFMAVMAFVFYAIHSYALQLLGGIFLLILAFFAGLEGFANWCAGCWIFAMGIRFGVVSDTVYHVHAHEKGATVSAWDYGNLPHPDAPRPVRKTLSFRGHAESPIDIKYQTKVEEWRLDNFNLIKHCKAAFFVVPLSLAALALALRVAHDVPSDLGLENAPWHVLFVAAVVVWCFLAVLYLTRVFVHPRKVFTELDCLERGNFAAAPFMTLTVFSALIATPTGEVAAGTDDLARALYWIGSSLTFVVAATRIAKWMSNRFTIDHVSPTWLLAPLGLLLSSIAGPAVEKVEDALESDRAYTESAAFFFAMAAASALLLMPLSFQAFLFQAHGDDGRRMSSWIYVAFFAVLSPSIDAITGTYMSVLSKLAVFASIGLAIALIFSVISGWMLRGKWTLEYWTANFALSAVAVAFVRYHSYLKSISARSLFSEIIAYLTLGVAAYATAVSCAYTLAEVYRGKFFVSLQPYTPLAVMKLTHDAIRGAEARLRALGEAADAAGPKSDAYAQLLVEAGVFVKLMWEHSKHEDTIVFKEVDNMVPGAQEEYEHEHEELHASLDELEAAIKAGKGVTRALGKAFDLTLPHLLHEEENIQQILRKTVPLPLAKDLVRRVWASTDARAWMEIVPWVVNNLPREEQRIKYCRAWMDAMPERCHQIGRFVYLGVAPSTWAVLRMHVPEMIPRGLKGFTHVW